MRIDLGLFIPKSAAKVLLFFDMTKYFAKKTTFYCIFLPIHLIEVHCNR